MDINSDLARRHPQNSNLWLHYEPRYRGLEVMVHPEGPMIGNYLETLYQVIHASWAEYPRTWAVRIDLRFPKHADYDPADACITRFIESLKAKVRHDRRRAASQNRYSHDSQVRYVWAREFGQEGKAHYHVLLLFNRDAYFTLGSYTSLEENMYQRINRAWANSLYISYEAALGLAQMPSRPWHCIPDGSDLSSVFYRASYLCKAYSKQYMVEGRSFGASQS
jgi:hypothetical protein